MRKAACICLAIPFLFSSFLGIGFSQSDPAAGILPLSTQMVSAYDTVDLNSSRILITIPVRQKAGKIPLSFDLIENNHAKVVNGGVGVSDELYGRGSTGDFGIGLYNPNGGGYDPTGASHYFTQVGADYIALDGSGYVDDLSSGIWDKSGNRWTDADNAAGGMTYTVTDPDGMQVQSVGTPYWYGGSYERVTTVYTDSLGATFLTSDEPLYGGAPPSRYAQPNTYSYVDASGATQTLTVNYSLYSMQANFTCNGGSGGASNPYAPLPSSVVLPTGGTIKFTYEATPGFPSGEVTGRIAAITLPSGGSITYTYGGANNGINCTDWFSSVPTLTRTVNDGAGHTATWTYVTTGFTTSLCSVNCYSTTTVTDPLGNDTVYTFFLECGVINTDFFCKTPIQTQKLEYQGRSSSNNVLRTTTSTYPSNTNCVVWVCGIIQYTTQAPISQNSGIVSGSATETLYDPAGSGNVVNTEDFDFGVNFPTPSGSALSDTVTTYGSWNGTSCVPLSNHLSDRPCSTVTTGPSGSVVSAVYNTYSVTGHATTTSTWVSGSGVSAKYLNSSASYYSNGTVQSSTDVNGGITSYTGRLCNGVFPGVTSLPAVNGVTLSTSQNWNCTGGVITSYTDSNGNPTTFGYINPVSGKADPLWRQTQVSYPDGGSSTTTYNTGITTPWTVSTTRAINGTQNWSSVAQYDGLGRLTQTQLTSDPVGTDYINTSYDLVGRVQAVTNPFRTTTDTTYGVTSYGYDALGRLIAVTHPDNTSFGATYAPDFKAVQIVDEGNNVGNTAHTSKIYELDGLGRMLSVCEVTSMVLPGGSGTPAPCNQDIAGSGFLTSYSYDALGNVLTVGQSGLNPRTYTYDGLSRPTTEVNPESGATNYTYDAVTPGDLYQRSRPAENQSGSTTTTTTYAFDLLHRLSGISYSDGTTPAVALGYDQSSATMAEQQLTLANDAGRLSWSCVLNSTGVCTSMDAYGYDTVGRVVSYYETTPLNNKTQHRTFQMSFGYDLLGDMVTGGSGTGRTWAATFNTAAQLTQVSTNYLTSTESGTLVSGIQYNALGLPVSSLLASGVQETRSYDNRRRLLSYSAGQKYTVSGLTYAGNNNVLKALDSENGAWSYTYDDFRRLATASSSSQGFSYSYDRYGNRWQQNLTAGAGPSPQYSFDANNHITAAGLIYDAAGNETNDTFHTYTYDAENRVTAVDGGTTGTYVYNARGLRVGRKNSTGNVEYLFDPTGEQITEITAGTATALQNEVLVGRHWATQRSTTYFPHSDWLGTMRVLTGLTGSVVESSTGLPFGDGAVNTGSDFSPFHFTEQPHDTESNLEHFPLRQYSSTQGRWVSPDPAGLGAVDISNPQTWDRYAYVSNNPLSLIDPAGTDGCDADSDSVTCDLSFSYGSSDSGSWGWYSDSFNGNNGASLSGSAAVTGFDPVTQRYIGDVDVSMNIAANVAALAPAMQRANATVKTFMAGQAIQVGVAAAVIAGPAVATHVAARGLGWYYAYAGTGVGVVLGRYPDYTQKAEEMGANALNVGSRGWDRGVYSFFNNAGEWWTLNQSYLQAQIFRGQQFTLSNVPWMQGGSYFEMELEYLQSRGIGWSYTPFDLGPLNWHLGD